MMMYTIGTKVQLGEYIGIITQIRIEGNMNNYVYLISVFDEDYNYAEYWLYDIEFKALSPKTKFSLSLI